MTKNHGTPGSNRTKGEWSYMVLRDHERRDRWRLLRRPRRARFPEPWLLVGTFTSRREALEAAK